MTSAGTWPRRRIFAAGAALSALLVIASLLGGASAAMDRFIAAIGAVGQIWIAALLLLITYDEFEFSKKASQRQSREANYDRRAQLRRDWQQFSRQIGYTALNEDNVAALGKLLTEVRLLFGEPEYQIARHAVTAARSAKRHAAA